MGLADSGGGTALGFRNPFRRPGVSCSTDPEIVSFHRSLPEYAPTPLRSLPALAAALGLDSIWIKDEGQRMGLNSFKVLGASWAAHKLLQQVAPQCLTTASAGNFGRAVAWVARQNGIESVIYLPADTTPSVVQAIEREGAQVVLVAGPYDEAVAQCAADANRYGGGRGVLADIGYDDYRTVPAWVQDGYTTIGIEVAEVLGGDIPDVVVVPGGVGGLASAVARVYSDRARIVVVEPSEADCLMSSARSPGGVPTPTRGTLRTRMAGLNCRNPCLVAWPVLRAGVDFFVAVDDESAEAAMARLFRPVDPDPSIEAGASGAASLAALMALSTPPFTADRAWLGLDRGARVLLIMTEGATDPLPLASVVSPR